ncbi:MAG: alpha/beta fold hydrolase [Sphingomonadales bacterium]|nr:alpha/beta fold hydrolase [Sphingomonadaceae bacterium]MBS3932541.1 alpha/beta fold hydrolase [Sphingomonadales bacterium]
MREEIWFDHVHAYFYESSGEADYSLLIVHGIGGNGSTYDVFCYPLAERGVNIYSMDLPGHGKTKNEKGNFRFSEWLADMDVAARAIQERHPGKPVFVLGSSQGAGPAFHSLATSDAIAGGILMGMAVLHEVPPRGDVGGKLYADLNAPEAEVHEAQVGDSERFDLVTLLDWNKNYAKDDPDILAKKMQDPLRAWSYGYASMRSIYTYQPPIPASANRKPLLVTAGEADPIVPAKFVSEAFEVIGGPKELNIVPNGTHQLMLYHTDLYVPLIDNWVRRQLTGAD